MSFRIRVILRRCIFLFSISPLLLPLGVFAAGSPSSPSNLITIQSNLAARRTTFEPSAMDQKLITDLIMDGVDHTERSKPIWYTTGVVDPSYPTFVSLISDAADSSFIGSNAATKISSILTPAEHTYACFQIEPPKDNFALHARGLGLLTSARQTKAGINVQKTADVYKVKSGDNVSFNIRVENTGSVPLTDVTVTDPLASDCDETLGMIQPGAVRIYHCTMWDVSTDFTNVAHAIGTTPHGSTVEATDDAEITVEQPINPSIEIQKTPDNQQIAWGTNVTFTIRIENTGDVLLSDVTVSDPRAPACDIDLGTMQPGDVKSYACMVETVTTHFTNTASVIGTPPNGSPVKDSDDATVTVQVPLIANPSLSIQKSPDLQIISAGEAVTFTIRVENTGNVDLTDVTVDDPRTPTCDADLGVMQPGDVLIYGCAVKAVGRGFVNVVSVVGTPPSGTPLVDTDEAEVIVLDPAIEIQKAPDIQNVPRGSDVTFTIRVENIGDVTLYDVAVDDPIAPNCVADLGTMAPGDMQAYECTLANVTTDLTNVASVTGRPAIGTPVSDKDDAVVRINQADASIKIDKSAENPIVTSGGTVTFTIHVKNSGTVALSNVTVNDPQTTSCNAQLGTLQPGDIEEYQCALEGVSGDFTNVASVTGRSPTGKLVRDADDEFITAIKASVQITKIANTEFVSAGQTATFTIRVDNTGDALLSNVMVTDRVAPNCDRNLGEMVPGAIQVYTCTLANITTDLLNIAVVVGTTPDGLPIQNTDDATVTVEKEFAILQVSKTDNVLVSQPGGLIDYTISYTNSGTVAGLDVTIVDVVPPHTQFVPDESDPGWDCDGGGIAAGTQCTFTISYLPPNTNRTGLSFAVRIDNPLPPEVTTIVNQIIINGSNNRASGQSSIAIERTALVYTGLDVNRDPSLIFDHATYMPLIEQR